MADIDDTVAPNSDQLDAVDLVSGERTFTITKVVVKASADQPVDIHLAEFPRVWRPGKSMRRILMYAWGKKSTEYVGRRITLYCDPDVRFGGAAVGGTRIRAMSHIDKPKSWPLLVSRGQSKMFTVQPLPTESKGTPENLDSTPANVSGVGNPLQEVGRLMNAAGITERAHAQTYVSEVVGREVASTKELTEAEIATLIEALRQEVSPT